MITPTLFVGLGTTGTEILMKLRELMYEEYGLGGLPVFRYIAIETDESMEVDNTNQQKDYAQINLVKASIANYGMIKRKLQPNDTLYNEHLDNWLNRDILTFANFFTAGAAHIRMAGRLCLWANWNDMQRTLSTADAAIHAPASVNTTNDILNDHFKTKGLNIDGNMVGGSTYIYIVGSLCGGTCSGMLIDMAYHCRGLIGTTDGNEIHGMFTMFDERAAGEDDPLVRVRSANCYGSLWEMNYYSHPETTYDVVLPNHSNRNVASESPPFDDTMLVSCSGTEPTNQFVDASGNLDLDGLNLMVALNLFAESVGNTRGLKDAMGINGQALNGYGTLKVVETGKTTVMMRNMASFGLTAVWYPKYRIASATAALVGQKVCENWRETHIPEATIEEDAKAAWRDIYDGNIDTLTNPDGLLSLKNRIDEHLRKLKQARLNKNISGAQLNNVLDKFPDDDAQDNTFKMKFAEGGQYHDLMKMQEPVCQKAFRDAIDNIFHNQLGIIDFQGKRGIKDVRMFFNKLDDEIEKEIKECPLQLPSLSLDKMDFGQLDRASKSFWLWSLWLDEESVKSHQGHIIDDYCDLIIGSDESIYEKVRKFLLRPILEHIRAELGFGVPPKDTDAPNRRKTYNERISEIEKNLNQCIDQLKIHYEDAIKPKKSICVKIVTNNDKNSIDEDARALSHQIINDGPADGLLDGLTMAAFLQKDHQEIIDRMISTYRGISLSEMRSHDVVKEVQKYVQDGNPEITNLANRSNPYQTFDANNYDALLPTPPMIIFGRDPGNNDLPQLKAKLGFSDSGDCSVDHLLLLYQEEYGFTIDDLRVFPKLKQTYFVDSPGQYGHSTHQDPAFYDLELQGKTAKLQQWCNVLNRLVREICQNINKDAFSGVFHLTSSGYFYEYLVDGLPKRLSLRDSQEGIKTLSQKQHTDHYDNFFKRVRTCFAELERSKVEKLTASILTKIEDNVQHERLGNIYRQFLNDVYANIDAIDDELDDDIDAHFYEQTHQSQEEDTTEETPDAEPDGTTPDPEPDEGKTDTEETVDDPTNDTDNFDEVIPEEDE